MLREYEPQRCRDRLQAMPGQPAEARRGREARLGEEAHVLGVCQRAERTTPAQPEAAGRSNGPRDLVGKALIPC